ncbi:hypothetical protein SNOG_05630 [Parastagonospora nodorum SN15]|uniref:Uncharacterized protein n=1 Tax=Phaeosphaeria nodorum (strain SN15 / ATCC MYA-4574 / FGSC 10173) TaxID=321614 RepID=Q0URI4_PHANO|nr:hypothetical protein SNOG_05630 [Parastagonospora nodorum SN15]EAT86694.1 hypothetical protein SNOG_05630 [Parastagonospora nodorum SN15]
MANEYAMFVYDEEVRFLYSGRVIHAYCRSSTDSMWCEYPIHNRRGTLNLVLSVPISHLSFKLLGPVPVDLHVPNSTDLVSSCLRSGCTGRYVQPQHTLAHISGPLRLHPHTPKLINIAAAGGTGASSPPSGN